MIKNLLHKDRVNRSCPQITRDDGKVFEICGNDYNGWEILVHNEWSLDEVYFINDFDKHLPPTTHHAPIFKSKIHAVRYALLNIDRFVFA